MKEKKYTIVAEAAVRIAQGSIKDLTYTLGQSRVCGPGFKYFERIRQDYWILWSIFGRQFAELDAQHQTRPPSWRKYRGSMAREVVTGTAF